MLPLELDSHFFQFPLCRAIPSKGRIFISSAAKNSRLLSGDAAAAQRAQARLGV